MDIICGYNGSIRDQSDKATKMKSQLSSRKSD
jgi:hypothetical protein